MVAMEGPRRRKKHKGNKAVLVGKDAILQGQGHDFGVAMSSAALKTLLLAFDRQNMGQKNKV